MTSIAHTQSNSARVRLGAVVVLVASGAVLVSAFGYDFFRLQADETSLAWQAKLARDGYIPYRDYFAYKPPLTVYLPATLFSVVDASLANLRMFSAVCLAGTSVLLYFLSVRARLSAVWAVCVALMLPALMVPLWPVPSGQWMSLAFGLAALLCVAGASVSWRAALTAGVLVAAAGLCVQTHGALFAGLLAVRLLTDPMTRRGQVLLGAAVGIGVPLLLMLALFWYVGALGDALRNVVVWPLRYYKQPGGFNDAPQSAPGAAIEWTIPLLLEIARLLFVIGIPSVASLASLLLWGRGMRGPRATFAIVGYVMLWFVFFRGRTDPVHLVFLAPVFLYLVVQHIDWTVEGTGVRLMRVWFVLAALFMVQWPIRWLESPPSIEAVRAADARWEAEGVPTVVAELPGVAADDLPVLFLGAHGASLYVFWAPIPPPVDWLQPPGDRLNSPEEFELIADFAQRREVPYIVLQDRSAEAWMRDPSPVRDVLSTQYRHAFDTSWGAAYCRLEAVLPSTGAAICDLPRPTLGTAQRAP